MIALLQLIIVSDKIQYEKIKNIVPNKNFIKKIIIFDQIENFNKELYLKIKKFLKKKIIIE